MHVLWSGLGAIIVGAGDFAGGAATRRDHPLRVTTLAFAVGTVFLAAVAVLFEGEPSAVDMGWGAVSGIGGALGVAILYRGFQRAAMGLVAPVAAVVTAAVPVVGGLVAGERPSGLVIVGALVGVVAIILISAGPAPTDSSRWSAVGHGLATGVSFGGLLLAITFISVDAGLLPLVAGRATSWVLAVVLALVAGVGLLPRSPVARRIAVGSGILTVAGNALYYLALTVGPTVTSTVIYSLFPASTVLLARIVYRERLRPTQIVGVMAALAATALLVAG